MKNKYYPILIFSLVFFLGVFCVPSCKKATQEPVQEPVVETIKTVVEKINITAAEEAEFKVLDAGWRDEILTDPDKGLAKKIEDDEKALNAAYNEGNLEKIADILDQIRTHQGIVLRDGEKIIEYFKGLSNQNVTNMTFKFAGAVVIPVNVDKELFLEEDINFISIETYMFNFSWSSGSADPPGSGGGDREHRLDCVWF